MGEWISIEQVVVFLVKGHSRGNTKCNTSITKICLKIYIIIPNVEKLLLMLLCRIAAYILWIIITKIDVIIMNEIHFSMQILSYVCNVFYMLRISMIDLNKINVQALQ